MNVPPKAFVLYVSRFIIHVFQRKVFEQISNVLKDSSTNSLSGSLASLDSLISFMFFHGNLYSYFQENFILLRILFICSFFVVTMASIWLRF